MQRSQNSLDQPSNPLVTLACLVIIVAGMKSAAPVLNPLFLAFFVAIICWPPLIWMHRHGVPAGIAVTLIISGLLIVFTILGAYVVAATNQFTRELPSYQKNLLQQTSGVVDWLHSHDFSLPDDKALIKEINAGKVMQYAGVLLSSFSHVFTNVFFILLTVCFILFESYAMPLKMEYAFGQSSINERTSIIVTSINQYLAIKVITSLTTGVIIAFWLAILKVDFPILWGVMAFMLNFIPNIGSVIAAIPTVLLALVQLGVDVAILVAVGYLLVNTVVGNLWETRIMGKGLGLSTLVVFLSLAFWGWVFGAVGMFMSVPFTMIAKIILESDAKTRWIAILLGTGNEFNREEEHKTA